MAVRSLARLKVCIFPAVIISLVTILILTWLSSSTIGKAKRFFTFPKLNRTSWKKNGEHSAPLVWPEDDPSDRILAQLSLTAPENAPLKAIYDFTGAFKVPLGEQIFIDHECNVRRCSFVNRMSDADAVLFRDRVTVSRNNVSPSQIWILYTLESPFHFGTVAYEGTVNWTATYRRDSEIVTPYAKWIYFNDNIRVKDSIAKNYAEGKTKKVAFFVSNCKANNDRLEFANQLAEFIEVDIYGRCGSKHCKRSDPKCFDLLRNDYKFYLAFENSNCRDYITEKFYENALLNDVLPIVMGAYPDDYNAGPEFSYIHVDNFLSVEDLAAFLLELDHDDSLYNSYFSWRGTGTFIDTKFYCRLCALLHTPRQPKTYSEFADWWKGEGICTPKRWIN